MLVTDPTAGIRAAIAAARLLTVVVAREASSLLEKHGLTVAGRAVLERLAAGPATVPHMAHDFLMTRQAVQRVVTDLAGQGLVEVRANPQHRRSSLIHLSLAGAEVLRAAMDEESEVLAGMSAGVTPDQWQECAAHLHELAQALATHTSRTI